MAIRVWLAGTFIFLGMISLTGCAKNSPAAGAPGAGAQKAPEVVVSKPVTEKITDYFEFPGQMAAIGEVEVRARVTGYVDKVKFEDGQNVKTGDLLYEIDPRPYQAALDRARGDLARWQAMLEKGKADVARSKRLLPSGAISQDEYETHKANLKVYEASIQSAEAAVHDAELNLGYTKIRSPIDGRVSRTRITKGNLVQLSTNDSAVLTTVVTRNPIYVYFDVDEQALLKYQALALRTGQELHPKRLKDLKIPVEIGLENEQGFPHAGIIDFADNKMDRTTGTLHVRGEFRNDNEYLTPGLYVRVRIPFGDPHKAILVPEAAVGQDQRERYLLTVNKEYVVEYRKVKLGNLHHGMMAIESGIGPDDWVIVKGLLRAKPGDKVTPHYVKTNEAAESPSSAPPVEPSAGSRKTK